MIDSSTQANQINLSVPRVQRPIASFPRSVGPTRDFDETIVEREVVSQRVLPFLSVGSIIRELVHDELIDVT